MLISEQILDQITQEAQSSQRLRKNCNFHESLKDPCQHMLNTMLVGNKFEVHCHTNTAETFVLLKGTLDLMYYNNKGEETERFHPNPLADQYGIRISTGHWLRLE